MKKQDVIIVALLLVLLLAWPMIYTRLFPPPPQSPAVTGPTNAPVQAAAPIQTAPATPPAAVDMMADAPALTSPPPKPAAPPAPRAPEQIEILRNDKMALTFSSYGAGIVSAELLNYRQSTTEKSPPVCRSHQLGIVGDDCPGHIGRVLGKLEHRHATRVPSASTPALAQLASIVVDDVEATGSHVL